MSPESKQPTDEALLGTELEQNVRRLYQEGKNILKKSRKFNQALTEKYFDSSASEGGCVQLRQPIEVKGQEFVYLIFFVQTREHPPYLLITKKSSVGDENHYSTLWTNLPASQPGEATIKYATFIEGGMEKAIVDTNTQTAVQKAEEFLETLKQDLP